MQARGEAEHHGQVSVVAALVRYPDGIGAVVHIQRLWDGQPIQLTTQQDGGPSFGASPERHQAMAAHAGEYLVRAEGTHDALHASRGAGFVVGWIGLAMQLPPKRL